jgi:hypothetical protein
MPHERKTDLAAGMIEFIATAQTAEEQVRYHISQMKTGRQYRFTVKEIRPGRTTGPGGQGAHFNGHIQQIANETGNDFDTIKMYVKEQAVSMGWPYTTLPNGAVLPKSETEVDVVECGYGIETCHVLAGELGIILREE